MYISRLATRLKHKVHYFSAPVKWKTRSCSTKVVSPITAYREAVDAGQIASDNHQLKVVDKLEELFLSLDRTDTDSNVTQVPDFLKKEYFKPHTFLHDMEKRLKKTVRQVRHEKIPKGLYIYGGVGVGKSYLMDLLYKCCVDSGVTRERGARRIHFHEFMKQVHQDLHDVKTESAGKSNGPYDPLPQVAKKISKESKLLCFDEFQVTDIGDAVILKGLFTSLFDQGVVVVATSNRAPRELYEGGLNRSLFLPFIDFLNERCHVIHVPSEHDYRATTEILDSNTYFKTPLSGHTTEELWQIFFRLSDHRKKPVSIDVGFNRKLDVANAWLDQSDDKNSVAFFSFDELCDRPLSAVDYLGIAKLFDYIIVDKVPVLDENHHNEARRFITMVDALYETGTTLIIGSNAESLDTLFSSAFNPNDHGVRNRTNLDEDEDANIKVWINAEGGSSSSSSTTMIGEMEWSATGRAGASLAEYSASMDVAFAFARAQSRLKEMQGITYKQKRVEFLATDGSQTGLS